MLETRNFSNLNEFDSFDDWADAFAEKQKADMDELDEMFDNSKDRADKVFEDYEKLFKDIDDLHKEIEQALASLD